MKSENVNEATYTGKPVIARKGGKLGAVLLDKDGKPIPGSWRPEKQVPGGIPAANKSAFFKTEADKLRSSEKDRLSRIDGTTTPPPPAAPPAQPDGRRQPSATPPAPPRRTPPTPQASPVAKYMVAASAARKIQDPIQRAAEMEKVKQTGMEIWKNKYKDTLAKPKTPEQKFNPLMQKTFGYQTGNAPDQIAKASAGGPSTPEGSALGVTAKPEVRKALNLPPKEMPKQKITSSYEYEPYDLVLEYLLSEGHADTVDEAHYVMMQMSSEHVQSIVENY